MTVTAIILFVALFAILGGVAIGYLTGLLDHIVRVRKAMRTRCRNCKHFAECQGLLNRNNDNKNNCKNFAKQSDSKAVRETKQIKKEARKISDWVETLFTLAEDNENAVDMLNKRVFGEGKENEDGAK